MSSVKTMKRNDVSGYRLLIAAIAISLVWHLFWLSSIKIVASRMPKSSVKFSKVAFLGPILSGINMEVRAAPASRGVLEKRYRKIAGKAFYAENESAKAQGLNYEERMTPGRTDQALSPIIGPAVAGQKLEPDFPVE